MLSQVAIEDLEMAAAARKQSSIKRKGEPYLIDVPLRQLGLDPCELDVVRKWEARFLTEADLVSPSSPKSPFTAV